MLNSIFRIIGIILILTAIYFIAKKSIHFGTTGVQGVKKDPPMKKKNVILLFAAAFSASSSPSPSPSSRQDTPAYA